MDDAQRAIIETISYFDVFDYPLTREEIFRWLWRPKKGNVKPERVHISLDRLCKIGKIEHRESYYFLPGKSSLVEQRKKSVPIVAEKLAIARRAARIARFVPFFRALFVCNTVASSAAKQESDIDVFIVIKKGRMWIARALTTFLLGLFRLRRSGNRIANKICLSFYVTDDRLDISGITIDMPDIYLMYWIDQLIPIYDPDDLHKTIREENKWVKGYLPHALLPYDMIARYRVMNAKFQKGIKRFFEVAWKGAYGDFLESQVKGMQKKKMKTNVGSAQGEENTHVIVEDTMLKFHENDRRDYFRKQWKERISV